MILVAVFRNERRIERLLVITLARAEGLKKNTKNKLDLTFIIYDFNDMSHEQISEMLGIQPTYVRLKGEKRNHRNPDSPLVKDNGWGIGSGIDPFADFDSHMEALLDIIEHRLDV
jgi:hypothetical protein